MFSDVSAFESIYGFNKAMEKGPFYSRGRVADPEKSHIFGAQTAEQHRDRSRKIVSTAVSQRARDSHDDSLLTRCLQLTLKHVTAYKPIISKNVAVLLERLGYAAGSFLSTFNVAPDLRRFTFDTRTIYRKVAAVV